MTYALKWSVCQTCCYSSSFPLEGEYCREHWGTSIVKMNSDGVLVSWLQVGMNINSTQKKKNCKIEALCSPWWMQFHTKCNKPAYADRIIFKRVQYCARILHCSSAHCCRADELTSITQPIWNRAGQAFSQGSNSSSLEMARLFDSKGAAPRASVRMWIHSGLHSDYQADRLASQGWMFNQFIKINFSDLLQSHHSNNRAFSIIKQKISKRPKQETAERRGRIVAVHANAVWMRASRRLKIDRSIRWAKEAEDIKGE